jgi:hypothetical protein
MQSYFKVESIITTDFTEIYALVMGIYYSTEEMLGDCSKFIDDYVDFREIVNGEKASEIVENDVIDAWHGYLLGRIYAKLETSC